MRLKTIRIITFVIVSLVFSLSEGNQNNSRQKIKKDYESAVKLLWKNDFEGSRLIFERLFSTNMIEQELKGNILYWWGESYYAEKDYKNSKKLFNDCITNTNDLHDKKPSCFLKLGLSNKYLDNNIESACMAFIKAIKINNTRSEPTHRKVLNVEYFKNNCMNYETLVGADNSMKNNNAQIDEAIKECKNLGFNKGTEKFGECVLKLLE